eukprot:scaffold957_cov402-Prasinococcus_capsulatus_cf.AAC.3
MRHTVRATISIRRECACEGQSMSRHHHSLPVPRTECSCPSCHARSNSSYKRACASLAPDSTTSQCPVLGSQNKDGDPCIACGQQCCSWTPDAEKGRRYSPPSPRSRP